MKHPKHPVEDSSTLWLQFSHDCSNTWSINQNSNIKTFPSTNLRMLKHSQRINNLLPITLQLKRAIMKLYVVVITQTLRPNSLPILITDKPETRHLLTDKVHSQMGKFTLV